MGAAVPPGIEVRGWIAKFLPSVAMEMQVRVRAGARDVRVVGEIERRIEHRRAPDACDGLYLGVAARLRSCAEEPVEVFVRTAPGRKAVGDVVIHQFAGAELAKFGAACVPRLVEEIRFAQPCQDVRGPLGGQAIHASAPRHARTSVAAERPDPARYAPGAAIVVEIEKGPLA